MASQLLSFIYNDVVGRHSYVGDFEVGQYLTNEVFRPGARHSWNEMLKNATGKNLTPEYFAHQFVSASN